MSDLPEQLRLCFNDLRFIAGVNDNQKICFYKRYYVDKDGWSGWYGTLMRTFEGERMDITGIANISSICKVAMENHRNYKDDPTYGFDLLNDIVDARKGLSRLKLTYESLGKSVTANKIDTSGIRVLDAIIPLERKIVEGFTIPKKSLKDVNKLEASEKLFNDENLQEEKI